MTFRINHNIQSMNTHRLLNQNSIGMSKSLEKLASGQKINRAADGPASLVISEHLKTQAAGTQQAIDNSETAVSMVQTAEANLSEVNTQLGNVRQLILHALNEGANDDLMLGADQDEINRSLSTINRISEQAQFGSLKLLDGSNAATGATTGHNLEFVSAGLSTKDSRENGFAVEISQVATKSHLSGTQALTQDVISAGEKLTVIEDGLVAEYTTNEDDTLSTSIQNLQNEINKKGIKIDVSEDGGKINLTHRLFGSKHDFAAISSSAGILSVKADEHITATVGDDIKGKINGESTTGEGQVLTGNKGAKCIDGLSIRYFGEVKEGLKPDCEVADLKGSEIEEPAESKFGDGKSVNVGRVFVTQNAMKFQVGGNRNQHLGVSVNSTKTDNLAKGIDNVSGYTSLSDIDVTTFQGASDALMMVDAAMEKINDERGKLGAFQKNSLESNLSNLRIGKENLVSSESVIRDTDMAKEMANFTKQQIMSQSSTAMLAQANQIPQNVMRLIG